MQHHVQMFDLIGKYRFYRQITFGLVANCTIENSQNRKLTTIKICINEDVISQVFLNTVNDIQVPLNSIYTKNSIELMERNYNCF